MTTHFGLFRPAHSFGNLALIAFLLALSLILLCAAPADGQVAETSAASGDTQEQPILPWIGERLAID